jgi:hypothetical protein
MITYIFIDAFFDNVDPLENVSDLYNYTSTQGIYAFYVCLSKSTVVFSNPLDLKFNAKSKW